MGLNRPIPPCPRWRVTTNQIGQWIVTDSENMPVFTQPDRLRRLEALFLAAQAPPLLVAACELARVVENLSTGYHRYTPILEFTRITTSLTRPPTKIVALVAPLRQQGELDIEAA